MITNMIKRVLIAASAENSLLFIPMTNHLIDVEEAEAECIRFAHALFLELNGPETSPGKLRNAQSTLSI